MPRTRLSGREVRDGSISGTDIEDASIQRADIDITTSGQALITKVIAGTNINISSTGSDAGTGDVTINATTVTVTGGGKDSIFDGGYRVTGIDVFDGGLRFVE